MIHVLAGAARNIRNVAVRSSNGGSGKDGKHLRLQVIVFRATSRIIRLVSAAGNSYRYYLRCEFATNAASFISVGHRLINHGARLAPDDLEQGLWCLHHLYCYELLFRIDPKEGAGDSRP